MKKITITLCFWLLLVSCVHPQIKTLPIRIGPHKFMAEVADTFDKRALGLMYRESIPDQSGMLLVFDQLYDHSIWMKNCRVSMDLLFINKEKQIVKIFYNVPPCKDEPCESYSSGLPVAYVLELRGNRAKELGIKEGDSAMFIR